jgi:hypothetical protein
MEELRGKSRDRNDRQDKHPTVKDEVARGEGKDSNKEMEFTNNNTEVEKGQRRVGKKGKATRLHSLPIGPEFKWPLMKRQQVGVFKIPPK